MDRRNLQTELAVGAFVLLAVGLTMWLIFKTGDLDFTAARGYELQTTFANASGLTKGSPVTVAGVIVGEVDDVWLERGRAKARLIIYEGNDVPRGSSTQVGARGLIGEKFVQINPGPPENEPYRPGDTIPQAVGSSDLDQVLATANDMMGDLREVSRSLRNVLGGPEGEGALREIVGNLRDITASVNRTLEENDRRINQIIANVERLSYTLAEISEENRASLRGTVENMEALTATLRKEMPDLMANLRQISGNLNEVVGDNRDNMDETLENLRSATGKLDETLDSVGSIAKKIDEGQGTLGKLVSDEETARTFQSVLEQIEDFIGVRDRFQVTWYGVGEYLSRPGDIKTRIGMRLQPRRERFYQFELVDDPIPTVDIDEKVTSTGVLLRTARLKDDNFKFTAMIGHRWNDLAVRGGFIESTGGAGIDYYLFDDDLRLFTEAWDFDTDQEDRHGDQLLPKLKLGVEYRFLRNFTLSAGGYDLLNNGQRLNDAGRGVYFSLGFSFTDDDLRDLLLQVPLPFR